MAKLVFVVALLVAYMAAPAASGTSTRWTTETSRRTESTTNSTDMSNSTDMPTTDEGRIKSYIKTAKSRCPYCHEKADYVETRNNAIDTCYAVEAYEACSSVYCYGTENVHSICGQAQDICANTTWPATDEGLIKHYILMAKRKCSLCQADAAYALTRSNKTDTCYAVDMYGSCSWVQCLGSENINSLYLQALDICATTTNDNPRTATGEEVIKHFIVMANWRCSNCKSEADFVQSRSNKTDLCNALDKYGSCTLVNCTNRYVDPLYAQAEYRCAPTTSSDPRTDSSTTWPSTDEGIIKHYIRMAKAICSKCQTDADFVLTGRYKTDICNAVDHYGSCSLVYCYGSENVNSLYVQAQDMCDTKTYSYAGTDIIRASMFAALATLAVARLLL